MNENFSENLKKARQDARMTQAEEIYSAFCPVVSEWCRQEHVG